MAAPMRSRNTWSHFRYFRRYFKENVLSEQLYKLHYHSKQYSSQSESQGLQNTLNYCVDLVNKHDYENYLCTLLLPGNIRNTAFALRAFNVEVAQISDMVSDKQRGLGRMQFWKDNIERIYQGMCPHTPVAVELYKAVEEHKLSRHWFRRYMDARMENLEKDAFRSVKEIEDFGENTVSSIYYLLLEALGVKNVHADHAASHIGRSQGIVTILRGMPYNTKKGHIYLPTDLLVQNKISQEDVYRGTKQKEVSDIVYSISSVANQHLQTARSLKKDVPKETFPIFLNTVICERYLKQIQQANFNVFDPKLQKRNTLLPVQLWLQSKKKTY